MALIATRFSSTASLLGVSIQAASECLRAIASGSWIVDGSCDPDMALGRIKNEIEASGSAGTPALKEALESLVSCMVAALHAGDLSTSGKIEKVLGDAGRLGILSNVDADSEYLLAA